MTTFKIVGIVGIHQNPRVAETVEQLLSLLPEWGFQVLIETHTAEAQPTCEARDTSIRQLAEQSDVVIAVGGDGNLLHAGRVLSRHNTPVIGINRGRLGFLTDVNPTQLEAQLKPMLDGKYHAESRFLIEGYVNDGKTCNALNDIVLFAGEAAQLVSFEITINNQFVYQQHSDGLIVSTPTGSTAYSLSAGGPIVAPELNVTLVVPKYPHNLNSRPLIVDADSAISIKVLDGRVMPRLSFDGHNTHELQIDDIITIKKQVQPLILLHPANHDYYHTLRHKLGWAAKPAGFNSDETC